MDRMLDAGQLPGRDLIPAIARRHVFPCWFGAALKLEGVDACSDGWTVTPARPRRWKPLAPKCSRCRRTSRRALDLAAVTAGNSKVKAQLTGEADGEPGPKKPTSCRLYSGAKYTLTEAIGPGRCVP